MMIQSSRRCQMSKNMLLAFFIVAATNPIFTPHTLVSGMTASPFPFQETQPDGEIIELQLNGDPNYSWMSDMEGYTVLQDPKTKAFVYAEEDGQGGLQASSEVVEDRTRTKNKNQKTPQKVLSKKQKKLRPKKRDCRNKFCDNQDQGDQRVWSAPRLRGNIKGRSFEKDEKVDSLMSDIIDSNQNHSFANNTDGNQQHSRKLSPIVNGTLRNLVILIKWADHVNRTLPKRRDIQILMNHKGPHQLCPSGSVRDLMLENSYGALSLQSVVTDWVLMNNTERFYSGGDRGLTSIFWDSIRSALKHLDDRKLVNFKNFDKNNDGRIDAITFLHSGYAAEFGGHDSYGQFYTDRIWSHKWSLNNGAFVSTSGVTVNSYQISSALWNKEGTGIGRIGVIAHELGHFLGLPDLYDGDSAGKGIGNYGLMSSSWGWDRSQYYPPHLTAWSKYVLGWLPAVVPKSGTNFIEAIEKTNPRHPQLYIVQAGFPKGEFLLIENRQRIGYDQQFPQGGLVIYHVDYGTGSDRDFRNSLKKEGYPGQIGWPENGNHYGVSILQADGLYELERGVNFGEPNDVFHGMGVDILIPCKKRGACQYPNTDSYQGGIISPSKNFIIDITDSADVMTFRYYYTGASATTSSSTNESTALPSSTPSSAPSTAPTSAPSTAPTSTPSSAPTSKPSSAPSFAPSISRTKPPTPSPTRRSVAGPCNTSEAHFELNLLTDYYAMDTSWTLMLASTGDVIASRHSFKRHTLYNYSHCLVKGENYTFQLVDSWGDSICCGHGDGYYSLSLDGAELFRGGDAIGWGVTHNFTTDSP